MFVRDYLRWARPWVHVAKAAISQRVRIARRKRAVLAVPVHLTFAVYYCAPGSIAKSSAGRSSKRCCCCKSSDTKYQFRRGFQHDEPLLWLHVCFNGAPHKLPPQRSRYQTASRRACVTSFKLQASVVEFFNRPWCGKRRVSWLSGADRQTPDPGIKHRQHLGMTHARRLGRFCTGFCTGRYLAMLVQRSSVKAVRRNFVIVCPGAVIFWSNHDVASQQDK